MTLRLIPHVYSTLVYQSSLNFDLFCLRYKSISG